MVGKARNRYYDIKERCYNPNSKAYKYYGAMGVTMCDEWKNDFKSFYSWFKDNYEEGKFIDKDILPNPDKVYSPDTCIFVSREINNRFSSRKKTTDLPEGVHKNRGKYYASISINNKKVYLTNVVTDLVVAQKAYIEKKIEIIKGFISSEKNKRVIEGLLYQLSILHSTKRQISNHKGRLV